MVYIKRKHFLLLFLLACPLVIGAQQTVETPRLVVSIVVDQLRGDYLHYFRSTFGEKGFKRLSTGGLNYYSVDFGFPNLNEASSIAALYTGTYPYYNGITGPSRFDVAKDRERSIVADDRYMGNFTSDRFSPAALQASTIGDELKTASGGQSLVYAIAPNAAEAILSGGRSANGAFWLDDYNGKWATSTYYKDAPAFVERYNAADAPGNFPDQQWTQAYNYYNALPFSTRKEAFSYKFSKNDPQRFIKLKQTPLINAEVTALAERFLENASLGNRASTDLLALTYYAGNYLYANPPEEYSYEIQDIYHRLDKELERLFEAIDHRVGLKHTLIILTSTGYYNALPRRAAGLQPAPDAASDDRRFHPNRCTALLNMYLMALYGQENWVSAYHDRQIYLNKRLAEDRQVSWPELVRNAADFVSQLSGVQHVTTAAQWLIDDAGRAAAFRRGMNKSVSGDLFLEIQPGWEIMDENAAKQPIIHTTVPLAPLFIYGEYIPKLPVHRIVKATEIAPTISYLLRIRRPEACADLPLLEVVGE
jgi:hypothetical protein